MKYVCLIYADESDKAVSPGPEDPGFGEMMAGYMAYDGIVGERLQGGEALQDSATATTVQVVDGEIVTTDGPFAETKEQLGGFYLLECADLDDAIKMASHIPHAAMGGRIEVRPVMDYSNFS